jgi:hydrogenase maturation protease
MSTMDGTGRSGAVVVIGVGNRYRSDDRAGLEAARRVRELAPDVEVIELEGEPTSLIDAWEGADAVYVIDAVSSGREPGTVYRFDARTEPPPPQFRHRGTHAFSVADVVELARALDRLPGRLVAYGIEGDGFGAGEGLSPVVEHAVQEAVGRLLAELDRGDP